MPARRPLVLLFAALLALAVAAAPAAAGAETRVKAKTADRSQTNPQKIVICWAFVVRSGGRVGTGQFITKDPIGHASGDTNLYRYAGNDPINRTDPTGLLSLNPLDWGVTEDVSNAAAGFGDGATGLVSGAVGFVSLGHVDLPTTYDIREAVGANAAVDFCSGWYRGGEVAGDATVAALAGGGAIRAVRAGREAWRAGRGGKDLIVSRKRVPTGGRKWRISPTGHRPNPDAAKPPHWGRNLPHYHRRPGIRKHRPWEGL